MKTTTIRTPTQLVVFESKVSSQYAAVMGLTKAWEEHNKKSQHVPNVWFESWDAVENPPDLTVTLYSRFRIPTVYLDYSESLFGPGVGIDNPLETYEQTKVKRPLPSDA
jgi:hypothetical protein